MKHADVLVRERGFSRFRNETQALFKIVGITDLVAWQTKELVFDEIAPKSVKKVVAGSGDASKDEVAAALTWFVGEQEYECDDESDSVAVGIAWLILNGYIMGENDVSKDD